MALNVNAQAPGMVSWRRRGGGLPDAAGVDGNHGLALGAAEGLAELVEVLHRAVGPPAAGGVGVGEGQLTGRLLGPVFAPDLGKSEEVALRLGIAVNLIVDGFALGSEGVEQGH